MRAPVGQGDRQGDPVEQLAHGRPAVRRVAHPVHHEGLGDRLLDRVARVEGGVRVLEDGLHRPAEGPQPPAAQAGHVRTVEAHRAGVGVLEAQGQPCRRGLAGAGLADDGHRPAPGHGEVDRVDGDERFGPSAQPVAPDHPGEHEQGLLGGSASAGAAGASSTFRAAMPGAAASRRRVYSCRGRSTTCGAGPASTTSPRYMTTTRSARSAARAEVVGDEDDRGAELAGQLGHLVEDEALDRDVERGRRLVGEHQLGTAGEGHGDEHPLAHPAGELVRVLVDAGGGVGDAGPLEQRDRLGARRGTSGAAVHLEGLDDLGADRHHGVEAGHRVLGDHPDPSAADPAQRALVGGGQVEVAEVDAAAGDPAVVGEEPVDARGERWTCRSRTRRPPPRSRRPARRGRPHAPPRRRRARW